MVAYNDKLNADEQIAMEEAIASYLFSLNNEVDAEGGIAEDLAAQGGRDILLMVLEKFRPDLISREGLKTVNADPRNESCACDPPWSGGKLHEVHATIERWPNERFHAVLTVDGEKDEMFTYALEQAHNWVVNRTAKRLLDSHLEQATKEREAEGR